MQHRNRKCSKLLAVLLTLSMLVSLIPAAFAAEGDIKLTILGTSDLHSNIWGYSYEDNKESTNNGMARVAGYVKEVRAENPNTILVDAGDFIQGTILSDDIYNKAEGEHPVITAMNAMKYDAIVLGNHEFNSFSGSSGAKGVNGIALVKRIQSLAKAPVLAANISRKDKAAFTDGYTIVERGGVKVGIIGLSNPDIARWEGDKVDELNFEAVGTATRRVVDEIKGKCDVIIAVAHVGYNAEYDEENGSDAGSKIIELCPEIAAVMLGHAHITFNEKKGNVVVGEPRNAGREVVRFDLTLDANKKVTDSAVQVVDMAKYQPDAELRAIPFIKEAHEKTIAYITGGGAGEGASGTTGGVFGKADKDFQPANEIAGIPEGKLRDTAVMDLINQVQLKNSGADVSAAALFKDSSDIKAGDINYGTIFGIYKFDNTLYKVPVTGKELKAYMEWSAACYNQWVPGDLSISFDPEKPGYLYDMFAGVDYEINLSKPAGSRIENVKFKGKPLSDTQELTLAVNNYRYSSALKANKLVEGKKVWESPNSIRDMLVAYITASKTVTPKVDNNWKITGVDLQEKNADRAKLITLINNGQLEAPYATSLKLAGMEDVLAKQGNVKVDGNAKTAAAYTNAAGTSYYRLRDLASALSGTAAQFNVGWDKGVVVTGKTPYADAALLLPLSISPAAAEQVPAALTVTVDGKPVSISANAIAGNYFISAADAATLLGVKAVEAKGILSITTK